METLLIGLLIIIPLAFILMKTIDKICEEQANYIAKEVERRLEVERRIRENKEKLEKAKKDLEKY